MQEICTGYAVCRGGIYSVEQSLFTFLSPRLLTKCDFAFRNIQSNDEAK
jgi:hypothetical protein